MKKTMAINAKHFITALLGIITLLALVGFSANATTADRQTTDYGIVDWSTATQGSITFTASGQERILVLQGPSGTQASYAVDKGKTVKIALADGAGTYHYVICNAVDGGTACFIDYKSSFTVDEMDKDLVP